ncbi:MAG: NUDIX domain-containing protein [Mucinivorans sp.]
MQHPLSKFRFCPACGSSNFEVHNATSKRCSVCGFTYYFNPRAAVAVLVYNAKGELLVARRAKEPSRGMLDLPGGFTESYETAEQSVAREIFEETSLRVSGVRYLFSEPNIYPYSGMDIHTMDLFFECHAIDAEQLHPADDVAECWFAAPTTLKIEEFAFSSIRRALQQVASR